MSPFLCANYEAPSNFTKASGNFMHYLLQNKHKVPPVGNIKMSIFRNSNILRGPKAKNSCKILSFQGKTPATGWPECHKQSSCWTYRQQDLKRILGPSPYLPSVSLFQQLCKHRIHDEIDGSRHDISDEISSTPLSYLQIHLTFSLVSLTRYASI